MPQIEIDLLRRRFVARCTAPMATTLLSSAAAWANEPSANISWERRSLLDGRISMDLPENSSNQEMPSGLMAPFIPLSIASRHFVQLQGGRVLFAPTEVFAKSQLPEQELLDRYLTLKRKALSLPNLTATVKADSEGGHLVIARPPSPSRAYGASLLALGLLRRADSTLVEVTVVTDLNASTITPDVEEIAVRAVSSIRSGPRSFTEGPGSKVSNVPMTIDVPRGLVCWGQRGHDFWVANLQSLPELGEPASRLIVYVGMHPSAPSTPTAHTLEQRTPLGLAGQWKLWRSADGAFMAEAFLRHDSMRGQTAHLISTSTSEQLRATLCEAADSGRVDFAA